MNEVLWLVGRGTGIAALCFLSVSVVLGILTARRWGGREVPRFAVAEIHRRASLGATILLLVHIVTLVLDTDAGLSWLDVVVPFLAGGNPFWYGLGTLATELVVVVAATGLLRKRLPLGVFRGLHLLSYACWPVAVAHGIGSGSDVGRVWFWSVVGISVVGTAAAVFWRLEEPEPAPARVPVATR